MTRTGELMKQFNLSGQTDKAAWDRIVRQADGEPKVLNHHTEQAANLRNENLVAIQALVPDGS